MEQDPRELPAYSVSECAKYLRLPATTVRYWSGGRGSRRPLVRPATTTPLLLSFFNLVELHILNAIRRVHNVRMPMVRSAIEYLAESATAPVQQFHPLISHDLNTDGRSLFIEQYGELINASQKGQIAMHDALGLALKRIECDMDGIPTKLFPLTRADPEKSPSIIVINPVISAGRPTIKGTGVTTRTVFERYQAGESINDLIWDYDRNATEIEEAIRCEIPLAA